MADAAAIGRRTRCGAHWVCWRRTLPRVCPCGWRRSGSGPEEALLAFGTPLSGAVFQLSARGDLAEAAANLFAGLRALDASGMAGIAVMPIPAWGLERAINDRLEGAAARGYGVCA